MKRLFTLVLLTFILSFPGSILAQEKPFKVDYKLTHEMTPEEQLRRDWIGRDFVPTDPPVAPVRMIAEFEEMQSILIRYPFGIPMTLIKEMANDCDVVTILANASEETTVRNQYQAAGVNMDNVSFLYAPTDSYWTRDYGPWYVIDGNGEFGIADFPYNRPRPNDDNIPNVVATSLGINRFGMDLTGAGGNYMCDGLGIAAATDLVWEENPQYSHSEIDTMVWDYLGIHKYNVVPDPLGEYIKHIDCWGKFLDVDKILIGQVPQSDYRYNDFEYVANYFAFQISAYGTPFKVYRVFTPGTSPGTPYTNSLILNKKVFVPITGSPNDNAAIQVYQQAMPGYEIFGIMDNSWVNTDAIHCRAIFILYINSKYFYNPK
jgi:agmatine deiminase